MHLGKNPIRFGLEWVTKKMIFIKHVISPFHPNFDRKNTGGTLHNERRIPHSFWMVYVNVYSKLGWKGPMTYLTKSTFIRDYTEPNLDGVFGKMQIISYILIFLKHNQVNSQFWKLLMLKVWLYFLFIYLFFFFFWGGVQSVEPLIFKSHVWRSATIWYKSEETRQESSD